MSEYPALDPRSLAPLRVIQGQLGANPAYLDDPDCPYTPELKLFLQNLAPRVVEASAARATRKAPDFLGRQGDKWAILQEEAAALYQELRDFQGELSPEDVAEYMSFFRTATSLLEKIVSINERAVGLKHIHEFQLAVLDAFEQELTPDQRTKVIERLQSKIDADGTNKEEAMVL